MAQELELYEKYDFALGRRQLCAMLRSSGVLPIDVSCRVDRYNRLSVEIEAAKEEAASLFKERPAASDRPGVRKKNGRSVHQHRAGPVPDSDERKACL